MARFQEPLYGQDERNLPFQNIADLFIRTIARCSEIKLCTWHPLGVVAKQLCAITSSQHFYRDSGAFLTFGSTPLRLRGGNTSLLDSAPSGYPFCSELDPPSREFKWS